MSTQFDKLLPLLVENGIEFILIGGVAGNVLGSARLTFDVDVVYDRKKGNLEKISLALKPISPYLRGAPPGLPFVLDVPTLRNGLNFTLITTLGDLDLLGEVAGGGIYKELFPHTFIVEAFGVKFRCVDLPTLIHLKRAAGRPKDLEAIAELEALLEETIRQQSGD
jgi:predicted nucleotidyltransferase